MRAKPAVAKGAALEPPERPEFVTKDRMRAGRP
jgi:hypothetical protein